MSASEWIGFGVAALLMGLLSSALLWISGRSNGVPTGKLRAALLRMWVAMVGGIGGLLVVRSQVGGGLVDYDSSRGALTTRSPAGVGLVWLALGLVWTIACLVVATRAASVATRRPLPGRPETDETRE